MMLSVVPGFSPGAGEEQIASGYMQSVVFGIKFHGFQTGLSRSTSLVEEANPPSIRDGLLNTVIHQTPLDELSLSACCPQQPPPFARGRNAWA